MSRLLKLQRWVTLEAASRQLSAAIGEEVSQADILRLALDGKVTLSVQFVNHASARIGSIVEIKKAKVHEINLDGEITSVVPGIRLDEGHVIQFERDVVSIADVWDLTMLGSEAIDIEHQFQKLTGGPAVDLTCLDGVLVSIGDTFAQLQQHFSENEYFQGSLKEPRNHPDNFYPMGALPRDAVIAVRAEALQGLIRLVGGLQPPEPVTQRPRPTVPPSSDSVVAGRPMSSLWPAWVAELAIMIHEDGLGAATGPGGAEALLSAVSERLAARGIDSPARSTLQATVNAVLRRFRECGY